MQGDQGLERNTASHDLAAPAEQAVDRLEVEATRRALNEPGDYLIFNDGEVLQVVALIGDWTQIGRSVTAEVRFDDPTVSRRHALIIREDDRLKLVDDSSLNGTFVAGSRVDRYSLNDGDNFVVGRFRINFVSVTATVGGENGSPPDSRHV